MSIKFYDRAQTPYQRLLRHGVLTPAAPALLEETYRQLSPLRLQRHIEELQMKLQTLGQRSATVTGIMTQRRAVR